MMASTLRLCPVDRLERRPDLLVRQIPEIRLCMVYRPRPAKIVTLNAASWRLLEACNGATVDEIEAAVTRVQPGRLRPMRRPDVLKGLQELVDLSLVRPNRPVEGEPYDCRPTLPNRPDGR